MHYLVTTTFQLGKSGKVTFELMIKCWHINISENRPWWSSGLSRQQCSHKLAAEDPGSNLAQGMSIWMNFYGQIYWINIILVPLPTHMKTTHRNHILAILPWEWTRVDLCCQTCNGWKVWSKGTTSMPKSVPSLVLDKVRQLLVSEVLNSNVIVQNVPNKSPSPELKKSY